MSKAKQLLRFLNYIELNKIRPEELKSRFDLEGVVNDFLEFETDDLLLQFFASAFRETGEDYGLVEFEQYNRGEYVFTFDTGKTLVLYPESTLRKIEQDLENEYCDTCAVEVYGDENARDELCHKCWVYFKGSDKYENHYLNAEEYNEDD